MKIWGYIKAQPWLLYGTISFMSLIFLLFANKVGKNLIDDNGHSAEILFITAFITLMLFLLAYYKLEANRKLQQEQLFLDALKHFHSETALQAKTYINEKFTQYYRDPAQKETYDLYNQSVATMSVDIARLIKSYHNTGNKNNDDANNKLVIHLINWLEYLEMLCFYYDKGIISKNHFKELFQHTIKFQFEVFKDYLDSRSGERFGYFKKVHDELCCFPLKNSQSIKS